VFIDLINRIPPNGNYLDIGAAIGYYPLLAKTLSPTLNVLAVEPLQRHRVSFLENMRLNGFSPTDFTIHDHVIASSDGVVQFIDAGYSSSILPSLKETTSPKKLIKNLLQRLRPQAIKLIKAVTLDQLVQRIGAPIDLVQIDVQGFEVDVLSGAEFSMAKGNVRAFLIGTHGTQVHRACTRLLHRHGYSIEINQVRAPNQPDGILVGTK
jgi:FkbM family methyltransferase